jgi:hypothetical protein
MVMAKRNSSYFVGNTTVYYVSEVIDGEVLDTEVFIGGEYPGNGVSLCSIAGESIDAFHEKLEALVNEYKI